ncbi:DHA2 family multidrug resistance protein-like MFS transporter [Nocardiopsis sp. Huas11]|uniref:MFS transporter n=1 Tax=Nocardiopsis sp. Huas11 TaxID=2183912 RepID=UPI000EAD2787|nr:MFS transporter [Nocardiopsis sp. Huas11]RKS08490.1 DHA2 family multidrug resistance protein-like MFS transporter [Nocardiopsis sp. Huas11]
MTVDTPPRAGRREWIGLAVLALPTLLLAMDMTVLHLAIPAMTADLRPTTSQMLWILDIYGFLIAGFLITMGTLGDRIGRRRLLLIGGAAFAATSVLAAFSTSAEMLILARALLGVAGATLMPSTLSLIRTMFHDPAQRTVAVSVWMTCFAVGGALGPILGGLLLSRFEWGAVFLLGVPVMLLLLVLGPFLLPEHRNADAGRLDLISAVLSLTAILSIVYGLKVLAEDGPSTASLAFLALGLLTGVVFVRRQRVLAHPLVDLTLFRDRTFSTAAGLLTVGLMVMAGSQLFTLQYLQLVQGLSPLQAGLWSLPNAAGLMVGAMSAPALAARTRPGLVIAGGMALTAVALASLTLVGADGGLLILVAASTLMGVGLGPMAALGTDLIVGSAPVERSGTASALSETSTELGAGLGIAVMGSIGFGVYRSRISESAPEGVDLHTARESLGAAVDLARGLGDPLGTELLTAAREAFVSGLHVTATVGAVTALAMAVLAALLLKQTPEAGEGEGSSADRSTEPDMDATGRVNVPTGT